MSSFKDTTWDLTDPIDTTSSGNTDLGYASNVDRSTILRNPQFLKDLQDRYDPDGIYTDEDLIDKFYSDENWAQLNTIGAVSRLTDGGGDTDEEKLRNARLTTVWDNLPHFYQEGGRGTAALGDIAESVLLDPINLIGGLAGKAVARGSMRAATALGKSTPIKSTLKGMGAAAATEGAISGGQEALINVGEQSYRQDIGLQDQFDWGQFASATGFGAVLGGGIGGAIGIPSSIAGMKQGRFEAEELLNRRMMKDPQDIARLTNKQATEAMKETKTFGPTVPEGFVAKSADEITEVAEEPKPKTSTEEIIEELEAGNQVFKDQLKEARKAQKEFQAQGIKKGDATRSEIEAQVAEANVNIGVVNRLKEEQAQIKVFLNDNSIPNQKKGRAMQALLDDDVAKARVALEKGDRVTVKSIIATAKARVDANKEKEVELQAKAETAKATTEKGTASPKAEAGQATGGEADVSSQDGEPPVTTEPTPEVVEAPEQELSELPEPNWGTKGGGGGKKSVDELLVKAGLTPEQATDFLKENIANGKIPTTNAGVIKQNAPKAVRAILKETPPIKAPEGAMPEEAMPFGQVASNLASANKRITDPDEMRRVMIDQMKRNEPSKNQADIEKDYDELISGGEAQKAADDELIRKIRLSDKEEVEMQRIIQELRQKELDWQANLGPESFKNFAPLDGEELLLNAKKMVLAKRTGRGIKTHMRNAQAAIDRASILTTAGRTESGKIQSFLKWRSDRVGLDKSEQSFVDNRMTTFGSAHAESMERLRRKGENVEKLRKQLDKVTNLDKKRTLENTIAQIESESVAVPFISGKKEDKVYSMTPDGRIKDNTIFEKGSVLYADARNGKTFDSEYTADFVYHQKDIRRTGQSKVLNDQPLRKGNRILIIKKKDGTGAAPIRIMNTQQEARGEGLKEMLGNQKPEDWEVRYIDQELVTSRNQSILPELWEKATPPLDATDGKGVLRFEGDETGNGMATPIENLAESPVTEGELNPQQALAFKRGGMNKTSTLADVQARIDEIEQKGFSLAQTETDYAILISDLEQLYSIQRDKTPGGIVRGNAQRDEITNQINNIMSDTDPELVVAIKNTLSYMAGDPNKAPNVLMGSKASLPGGAKWSYDKGEIRGTKGSEPDRDFFHAISQWAYDNILTPEDRMVFWNSIVQDISVKRGAGKTRTKKLSEEYGAEGSILPRQVFGDQFASWVMDNRTAGIFAKDLPNGKKMGAKVSEVLKGSIDRYFSKKEINPNLEPLFSKILPEEIRQMKKLGNISDKPQTKAGEVAKGFKARLKFAKEDMIMALRENASEIGNPDRLVNAAVEFRNLLGSAFAGRDIGGKSTAIAKTLQWLRPLDKMGRGRFADLNYILSGAALPDELKLSAKETSNLVQEGLSARLRPESTEAQANLIEELFDHGHAATLKGGANARPYVGTKTDFTTLTELIRLMEEATDAFYVEYEGKHLSDVSINLKTGEVKGKPDPAIKRRLNQKKNENANAENEAKKVVTVVQKKRKSTYDPSKRMDYVTEATRVSYGNKSYKELLELFKKTKDTKLGDQIAWLMMSKKKAEPEPLKTKLSDFGKSTESSKLFNLQKPEILKLWKDGIRTGRFVHGGKEYPFSAIEYEVQRRGLVDKYKLANKKPPVYLRQRIKTELNHGVGVATEDGIPPSAPIGAKTILSYMSHRDPEVQFTQRTMLYRMMNLMGKNVQNTLGETNVMDASDIARLAGDDPAGHKNVSVDFRGETFNKLRKNLRRMSIGLTKGNSNPFDAIHEIGHTIVRAGMLPTEEMDAVIDLYRSADDTIKQRVKQAYSNKYDAPEAQQEQLLAEEWFAENLANYLGERTMRGDVLKAMSGGNLDNIRLKNSFERAFDRIVEYVSYVVNGLIGRKDIKQQFRRLTIYGDMLESTGQSPLVRASVKEPAISPAYVNAYASDVIRQSKPSKKAAIHKYNGGGKFSVREDGTPIVYYHATPNGGAFKNSQVVMEPGGGLGGPGIYISPNSRAVEMIYGNRPTMGAIERLIRDKAPDLGEEKTDALVYEAMDLHDLRVEISQTRRKLAEAADDVEIHNDEVMHFQNAMSGELDEASISSLNRELKTKQEHESDLRNTLTAMLEKEDAVMAEFDQQGINFEPTVLPLVTRMLNTFDLGKGVTHRLIDPQIKNILRSIYGVTNNFEGGDRAFADEMLQEWWPKTGLRGQEVYDVLMSYVRNGMDAAFGTEGLDTAQAVLNEAIEKAGYDSIRLPHQNRMTPTDMTPEDAIRGELMEYDAFVVFNPEGVKHVNAEFFDAEDARLYYRDFGKTGQGFNGSVVKAMADGETSKLDTSNTIQMLEAIEDEGVSAPMVDAMSSILRSRDFTPIQEQAVRKQGPMAWLTSQSDRMERMGMNWLGKWYKDHFPNQHQTFASKYMPIHNLLRGLPGADGKVRAWARSASASIGQKQPQAYSNIVSALRHGDGSRQWNRLTQSEKSVAEKIKDEFNKERQRMIEAGMFVGYRRNYVPQIWNRNRIEKNRAEFLAGMRSYYGQEQTSLGNTFQSADADAFAEKVYQSLTRESVDGVQVPESPKSPIKGSTKNPRAESLDFNRVIELEKYPAAMKEMEKFLEDDLEFMLVKYFEGSTRRTLHTEKFGLNSHGVDDYLYVTENGSRGIAKLLSTNKVYQKDFRSVTSDGVEEGVLRSETVMPFHNDEAGAVRFADELIEIAQAHGSPAVKEKLESISVGDINPTYRARIEAIVGALGDHKGVRTRMETDDARFIENSMRVARKDSLNDFGGKAGLKASRTLRTFNNVTLLGFTTLTSLGDLVLPIIRSGSFTDWTKSVYQLATDPDYRRALKEVGIAMENITHERMLNMYGAADSKLSNAFFNATMLTPWTDMNRQVAGALGHQTFITHQRKALRSYIPGKPVSEQPRDYKIAYRYMKNFGLQEYLEGGTKSKVSLSDTSLMQKDDTLRKAMIRFADESIFQPNANDTPMFAQTPLGALAFQLKSFPLMMTRLAGHVIREANLPKLLKGDASESNIKPLLYFATLGPAFGMGALAAKDIVQMRGGEDEQSPALRIRNAMKTLGYDEKVHGNEVDFWGWYMEGMLQMGGVGLLGDIFHSAVTQADNGSYGQTRFLQTLGGPSVGLVTGGLSVLGGTQDAIFGTTDSNSKERTALREVATRIPVVGGIKRAREGIVDMIGGEASGGSSSGWGKGWGGSWN